MAAITTVLAAASFGMAAGSAIVGNNARKDAKAQNAQAAIEQGKARSEEGAMNAARAAQERRQQIREERLMRGKMLQSAENSGVTGSSGESGATSGLAAQLGANIGFNLGQVQGANAISIFSQNAANYQRGAQQALSDGQGKSNLFDLAASGINTYVKQKHSGK